MTDSSFTTDTHHTNTEQHKEPITIFLAADENYARYIAVVIASIMEQTEHHVDFYILDCGIAKITKKRLIEWCCVYSHASIAFCNIPMEELADFPVVGHISLAMYACWYIADLVPNVTKALYIDVDACVMGDIVDLFYYDLQGYGLGAVSAENNPYAPTNDCLQQHKRNLMMRQEELYFGSGILLIDCVYWRKSKIKEKCLDCIRNSTSGITLPDQDVLKIFKGNYMCLPPYIQILPLLVAYDKTRKKRVERVLKKKGQCITLQYYTAIKPWNMLEVPQPFLFDKWWEYAKYTPFYTEFLAELLLKHAQVHTTSVRMQCWEKFYAYMRYKFSFGSSRRKLKEQYLLLKSL